MKNHLLIIDDEENLSFFLKQSLDKEGYTATIANTIAEADEIINRQFPDLLLLDLNLSDGNGLDLYRELRKKEITIPTIVITAHGSVQSAIDALKMGVDDYIAKPFDLNELLVIVENLLERFHLFNQLKYYRQKAKDNYDKQFFVSQLLQIKEIQYLALKIAEVPTSTVLIEGTTGTGKEMFARYIHNNSLQIEAPFVEINCASIPDNLLESELFGYEPGAFTDAKKRKIGLIELAKGGTLFLDEIAEMSTSIQAKLLRFIETLSFKRLGGVNDIKVEVRIIAATNKDIEDYVSKGKFREDLFFRLNMFRLKLPKLCERKEEILLLAQFFLEQISARLKKKIKYIAPESKKIISNYNWPGNLRELHNVLERAIILCNDDTILPDNFPEEIRNKEQSQHTYHPDLSHLENKSLKNYLNSIEAAILKQALDISNGNQLKTARLLNEPRHVIRYLIKKHKLE